MEIEQTKLRRHEESQRRLEEKRQEKGIRITFDKSATPFVLEAFGCTISESGVVLKDQVVVRCGICNDVLLADNFAGAVHGAGLICGNIECLMEVAKRLNHEQH